MQELHYGSCRQDVVQGARGLINVLYKLHGPQTPWPSHQVLFRTTHHRCGEYSPSVEKPLQIFQRDITIHQHNGVAQRKSKREKLVINDKYMHAVALKLLIQSGEYKTETREWSKLPED